MTIITPDTAALDETIRAIIDQDLDRYQRSRPGYRDFVSSSPFEAMVAALAICTAAFELGEVESMEDLDPYWDRTERMHRAPMEITELALVAALRLLNRGEFSPHMNGLDTPLHAVMAAHVLMVWTVAFIETLPSYALWNVLDERRNGWLQLIAYIEADRRPPRTCRSRRRRSRS